MVKSMFLLLALAITVGAQQSNVRVAASLSAAPSLGYSSCLCGVSSGFDIRKGRFDFSADGLVERVTKTTGGAGYSLNAREAGRVYFGKAFIEGDFSVTHYAVQFSKTNISMGGGAGAMLSERVLLRGVFLTHAGEWSHPKGTPNNQNVVEGSVQAFLAHHIYVRGAVAVSRFQSHPASGVTHQTGAISSIEVGLWK